MLRVGILLLSLLAIAVKGFDSDPSARQWRLLSPGGSTKLPRHVCASGSGSVLLVAGEDGLFFSGDNGESWVPRSSRFPARNIQGAGINPVDPQHWVVTTANGFYQSFTGGGNWTFVTPSYNTPTQAVTFSSDGNTILVGTGAWLGVRQKRSPGIAVPTDGLGNKWQLSGVPKIFRSANKGISWSIVHLASGASTTMVNSILFSPQTDAMVWATIGFNVSGGRQDRMSMALELQPSQKLVRSTDAGATWAVVPEFPSIGIGAAFGVSVTRDNRFIAVSTAMRSNLTVAYNGTVQWTDAILVAQMNPTTGSIEQTGSHAATLAGAVAPSYIYQPAGRANFFRVEGNLPSGGRLYRSLSFDGSSYPTPQNHYLQAPSSIPTLRLTIRAAASTLTGDSPGVGEGVQTGWLDYDVASSSFTANITWYKGMNSNTSKPLGGWEEGKSWLSSSVDTNLPYYSDGNVFATSRHGLFRSKAGHAKDGGQYSYTTRQSVNTSVAGPNGTVTYSTTFNDTVHVVQEDRTPYMDAYSQSWPRLEGFTSRGWDALELNFVVVDPSDEKHIVVGAEEQFGFESFNGGLTWSNLATRAGNDTADPSTRCTATYNHAAYGFAQGFYCHNQSGIIDRSRAAGFVGNKVPLLFIGGAKADANETSLELQTRATNYGTVQGSVTSTSAAIYAQYWNGTFVLVAGGEDLYNIPQGTNGPSSYSDKRWELSAVYGDSHYPDLAFFGFSNGMIWMATGCQQAAVGDAASHLRIRSMNGWSSFNGQLYCGHVRAIEGWGNATQLLIACDKGIWRAAIYPFDYNAQITYDSQFIWNSRLLPTAGITDPWEGFGWYRFRGIESHGLHLWTLDSTGLCVVSDVAGNAQFAASKSTLLSHAAASALVHNCDVGFCPNSVGRINEFAVLNSTALIASVTSTSSNLTLGKGLILVKLASPYATTMASSTLITGSMTHLSVKELQSTSSSAYAVTEENGLWSWEYNWVSDGDMDYAQGWHFSGSTSQSTSHDSSHGLAGMQLMPHPDGSWAETIALTPVPDHTEALSVHLSFKNIGGPGAATLKFFDVNGLPLAHKLFTLGGNNDLSLPSFTSGNSSVNASFGYTQSVDGLNSGWQSKHIRVYPPYRSTHCKLQLNTSLQQTYNGGQNSLYVDHVWIGAAKNDTTAPVTGGATPHTTYDLPSAPGSPLVTALGGASVNTAFVDIAWTAPDTTYSGALWYYEVHQKQAGMSDYQLAGVTSELTYSVRNLYRGSVVLIRVYAVNQVGQGTVSDTLQVITANTVPDPPTNVVMDSPSTASQINIRWSAPNDNGGTPITSYKVWLWSSAVREWTTKPYSIKDGMVKHSLPAGTWDAGTRIMTTATSMTFNRLPRNANFRVKVVAANAMGDSAPSAESGTITTTALYEPMIKIRLKLVKEVVANNTESASAVNTTLAHDLAVPACLGIPNNCPVDNTRFYIETFNASTYFRMLEWYDSTTVTMWYLSRADSTQDSLVSEVAKLRAEVIDQSSKLHTQGIVTRSLDYGYWHLDWQDGTMVDAYEWSLGMFAVRDERLSAFMAIFLGLIFFCCIPGGVLAWMPYYHQLKGEGYSNQEIFVATLKLWWKHAMLWKRRLMRRWNKHCQPWWAKRCKCCRPDSAIQPEDLMDQAAAQNAQAMKVH